MEMAAWVVRNLPIPDEVAVMSDTRTSALLALRRILVQSCSGNPLIVTPSNVLTVIQHHEAAKLVVGVNMGGIVALNLLVELLRLALGTSITSIALGQLASGMAMLDDLRAPWLPKAGPCFDSTTRQDMFWGRAGINARPRWGKRAVYAALELMQHPSHSRAARQRNPAPIWNTRR